MSNVKNVHIAGTVPFNLNEKDSMAKRLAYLNTPCSGLRIAYGDVTEYRQNDHGGQTAFYPFSLTGAEAVSSLWLQGFVDDVKWLAGRITTCRVTDIEANETVRLNV